MLLADFRILTGVGALLKRATFARTSPGAPHPMRTIADSTSGVEVVTPWPASLAIQMRLTV